MSAAVMAPTTTLTPIRPSGLSRSTATFYSSSSLPPSSLDSWSLDHSCTTFGRAVEAAKASPQHRRSSKLIDDDPDINEEEHMRGIKRNRHSMTKSPATKRRCSPFRLASSASSCEASSSVASRMLLSSSVSSSAASRRTMSSSVTSNPSALYKSDKSFHYESATNHDNDSDSDEDDENCPMPAPPIFRRRSTIKDPFDLASSMEEFQHLI